MSGSRTSFILNTLILLGLASPVFAQNQADPAPLASHAASFLPQAAAPAPASADFSGLASPPELIPPPVTSVPSAVPAAPATSSAPGPANSVPSADMTGIIITAPVSLAPLPNVSPESLGAQNAESLGTAMWKGTPRAVAERLLSMMDLTSSPVLNDLARRLLAGAAVPPEGTQEMTQSLTAMRIEKLVAFGDSSSAWMLATHADPKLIDDTTFHLAAESALAANSASLCPQLASYVQTRTNADWQKDLIICQLSMKDTKAAQVGLDVMRAQAKRDDMFILVADKNIISANKTLPNQLTPLSAPMLALLRLSQLPLSGELYGHPDFALVPALLQAPAKEDIVQLGLAERAAQRGVISSSALAAVYKSIIFSPEELASALTASEPGARMRALLYRAALAEKDPVKRISYGIKFMQSASVEVLNGAGGLFVDILGGVKADPSLSDQALAVAHMYMLANRGDLALDWYRLARGANKHQEEMQSLWPQFVLAGLEADSDYAADFDKWLDTAFKPQDVQSDTHTRDALAATLLFLDASGFKIPDSAWAKVLTPMGSEKRTAFSALLFERLHAASNDNRRAETVLLAINLAAGDGDIPLSAAVSITQALRAVGLKGEAATFARHMLVLQGQTH